MDLIIISFREYELSHNKYRFGLEFLSNTISNESFQIGGEISDTVVNGNYQSVQLYMGYEWQLLKNTTQNTPFKLFLFAEGALYHGKSNILDANLDYHMVNRKGIVNNAGIKISVDVTPKLFIAAESAIGTYAIAQEYLEGAQTVSTIGYGFILNPIRGITLGWRL